MVRKLMFLLVFLAAFGQALAVAPMPRGASGDLGHVLTHAQEDAHHHHDDGSLHLDDAGEGSFHVHLDGSGTFGMACAHGEEAARAEPQGPPSLVLPALPVPPPADLLRPPKLAA